MTIYHIDDEYSFEEVDAGLSKREELVIRESDHVIAHSNELMERKGRINPSTSLIPNGVDYAAYATSKKEPDDLAPIPRPRIGYIGVVKKQLDLALLADVARAHPKVSLVIVGPIMKQHAIEKAIKTLRSLDNVWFLGNKSPHALPAYTQHIDIGLQPYLVNDYTNAIYPLKLHEYLAAGIPVLSTPIKTALEFEEVVEIADGAEAWAQAVSSMLADESIRSPEQKARRQAIAKDHDWNVIAGRIAALIREGIA